MGTRLSKHWAGLERDLRTKWVWLLVFNAALLVWLVFKPAGPTTVRLVCAAGNIVAPLVGLAWCLPWWRLRRGRDGAPGGGPVSPARELGGVWAAAAFSAGLALLAGAQCAWYYYEILKKQPPFPSWADLGYSAAYPFLVGGILLAPSRPLSMFRRGQVVLDSAITIAALGAASWHFLLGPIILGATQSTLGKVLGVAYPIGDLVVLFCLLLTTSLAEDSRFRRGLLPLTLGLLTVVVTDVVFAYQQIHGMYVPATVLDVGWPLGYMLVGLGARAATRPSESGATADPLSHVHAADDSAPRWLPAWRSLLPSALIPVVGALGVRAALHHRHDMLEVGVWVAFGAVALLALLRQVLTLQENAGLYARLRDAFGEVSQSHSDLAAANAALARSEERFRTAAQCARDVIYEWHADTGQIQWFGDVDAMLGRTQAPLPPTLQAWEQVIHPVDRPAVVEVLRRSVKSGEPFNVQYRVCQPDGAVRIWRDRGRIVPDAAGAPRRMIGVVSDVTDHQRAAALESERAGLRQAVAAMEGVLGVVGHELRTPLAGVRAMSEFLLTDGAPRGPEAEQFIRGIHDEIVKMADTVNELIEAARLNSGLARWNWERFSLSQVCDDAVMSVRSLVDESRVRLACSVTPADAEMWGDADAVRRLVLNLLGNSRKHTTDGEIAVGVDFAADEGNDAGRWIRITVRDTGCGIPPQILDRLGEAFALNAGLVGEKHVGGAGLGLPICRAVALAHGGGLEVQSVVGKGTTVTVRMRADLPGPVTESAKGSAPGMTNWGLIRNRLPSEAGAGAEAA